MLAFYITLTNWYKTALVKLEDESGIDDTVQKALWIAAAVVLTVIITAAVRTFLTARMNQMNAWQP